MMICILSFFWRFSLFLERGEGRKKERERSNNAWLPLTCFPQWGPGPQPRHVPWLGIKPTAQACALTGNWTGNPLVYRPALNPLSHTSQGCIPSFYVTWSESHCSGNLPSPPAGFSGHLTACSLSLISRSLQFSPSFVVFVLLLLL